MSISTKTGDSGQTSLWSGERVFKDDIRVESYGTVDELNSFLGEAMYYANSSEVKDILLSIQRDLFRVAGQLASKDVLYVKPVCDEDVQKLTDLVHHYEEIIKLKGFVIPGSILASAKLDICRTVCRRAERRIVALNRVEAVPVQVGQYINRLSDLLFIVARYEEYLQDKIIYK